MIIIKAWNDNVYTLRFRSPAIYTTYTMQEPFETRAEDQLLKVLQVVNVC